MYFSQDITDGPNAEILDESEASDAENFESKSSGDESESEQEEMAESEPELAEHEEMVNSEPELATRVSEKLPVEETSDANATDATDELAAVS